jgi:hypothetical protein
LKEIKPREFPDGDPILESTSTNSEQIEYQGAQNIDRRIRKKKRRLAARKKIKVPPIPQSPSQVSDKLLHKLRVMMRKNLAACEFCSRSEAVCSALMEHYIPGYTAKPGETFQIPVSKDAHGNVQAIDFMVEGILFEYHPVRFWRKKRRFGDFAGKEEYRFYNKVFHSLKNEARNFFQGVMRQKLIENYFRKRRGLLDANKLYRRVELIVADSAGDFYSKVIRRFGVNVPGEGEFLDIFEKLRRKSAAD